MRIYSAKRISCAGIDDLVKALNKVDFPTFGKPTIPHFNDMYLI
jgi:hypothetical protein